MKISHQSEFRWVNGKGVTTITTINPSTPLLLLSPATPPLQNSISNPDIMTNTIKLHHGLILMFNCLKLYQGMSTFWIPLMTVKGLPIASSNITKISALLDAFKHVEMKNIPIKKIKLKMWR